MSSARSVAIAISNENNSYPLTLVSVTGLEGTFNTPIPTTIAANAAPLTVVISNDSIWHGADALITWTTGSGDNTTIVLNVSNAEDQISYDNLAQLTITNADPSTALYGTSYLYAGIAEGPKSRDFPPSSGVGLCVDLFIVQNAYNQVNPGFLPGINNVVWLMLENRGLDHLMGQLYTESNPATNFYPSSSATTPYIGLGDNPTFSNSVTVGQDQYTTTAYAITPSDDPTTPDPDPGEAYEYVNNQLFYPGYDYNDPPAMQGFLYDYYTNSQNSYPDCEQIMGFYTPEQLPVISGLAQQYAISDAWFCSVPTQTYANRAYSVAGTTSGFVDNGADLPLEKDNMNRTMFNVMLDSGITDWTIYTQDDYWLNSSFITYEFETMDSLPPSQNPQPIANFLAACKEGGLPQFSYIEPAWYGGEIGQGWNGNDYHPIANLLPGEQMLNEIYQALASNTAQWNNTLFIVTFDEHGGTMDHVAPPNCTPPDGVSYSGDGLTFNFDRLGVRIPTLLISPQIPQGTVFRSPTFGQDPYVAFDHTSFVKVILGWMGIDVSEGVMGARAAVAPDFSGVLSGGDVVNPGMINITPYGQSDAIKAAHADLPLNDLQKKLTFALAESISDGGRGSEEHMRTWEDLKSVKSLKELQTYVKNAKAARAAKKKG